MQNSFEVTISKDRLVIGTTDGFVLSNTLNSVALDENENILIVGESQEGMQESSPDKWHHIKSRAQFVNPFSADGFRPEVASIAINYSAASAVHLLPEEQKRMLQGLTKWQIHFNEYEKLDKKS